MNIEYLADQQDVIPTLARWTYDEWSYLHPERTLAEVEQLTAAGINRDRLPILLVAMDAGKAIGMVALQENDFKDRLNLGPWLAGLYVEKSHRKMGVGTSLVHEAEKLAAQLGAGALYLVTDKAIAFYASLGWDTRERTVSQGIPVAVMEKNISRLW